MNQLNRPERQVCDVEMIFQRKHAGFSLIELLVVVAIIGVIALAGIYGYIKYMETTRASLMDSGRKEFVHLLEIEMARPSSPANGVAYADCFELIDAAINSTNKTTSNVYTGWTPVWFNGHREVAASGVVGSQVKWGQGEQLVICDDPSKTMGEGNNVAVCSCTDKSCTTSAIGSYDPNNLGACPNPRGH